MKVHFDGKDYEFDLDAIDVSEARHIKRQIGMSILKFHEGILELDPDCLVAAYWLMLKQNNTACDMNKVNFKVAQFGEALIKALVELSQQREAEAEANPTEEDTAQPEITE